MYGIQVVVWPLVGFVTALGWSWIKRRPARAHVLFAGALAASIGGVLGHLVGTRVWTIEGSAFFGLLGAGLGAAAALAGIDARARRRV